MDLPWFLSCPRVPQQSVCQQCRNWASRHTTEGGRHLLARRIAQNGVCSDRSVRFGTCFRSASGRARSASVCGSSRHCFCFWPPGGEELPHTSSVHWPASCSLCEWLAGPIGPRCIAQGGLAMSTHIPAPLAMKRDGLGAEGTCTFLVWSQRLGKGRLVVATGSFSAVST